MSGIVYGPCVQSTTIATTYKVLFAGTDMGLKTHSKI